MVAITNVFLFAVAASSALAGVIERRAPPAALIQVDTDVKNVTTYLKMYDGTVRSFVTVLDVANTFRKDIASYNNTLAATASLPAAQCTDIINYLKAPIDADVQAQVVQWDKIQASIKAQKFDNVGKYVITSSQLDFNNLFKNVCRLCPSGCAAIQQKINSDWQVAVDYYNSH